MGWVLLEDSEYVSICWVVLGPKDLGASVGKMYSVNKSEFILNELVSMILLIRMLVIVCPFCCHPHFKRPNSKIVIVQYAWYVAEYSEFYGFITQCD